MLCPICRASTKAEHHGPFRTPLAFKEFQISRLCQACQDEIFCFLKSGLIGPCNKPCCNEEGEE